MKRPSFQFYPADWQANSNLRRCTHAEKGVWISVMCLMHDSEEYGILRWTLKESRKRLAVQPLRLRRCVSRAFLKVQIEVRRASHSFIPRVQVARKALQ